MLSVEQCYHCACTHAFIVTKTLLSTYVTLVPPLPRACSPCVFKAPQQNVRVARNAPKLSTIPADKKRNAQDRSATFHVRLSLSRTNTHWTDTTVCTAVLMIRYSRTQLCWVVGCRGHGRRISEQRLQLSKWSNLAVILVWPCVDDDLRMHCM